MNIVSNIKITLFFVFLSISCSSSYSPDSSYEDEDINNLMDLREGNDAILQAEQKERDDEEKRIKEADRLKEKEKEEEKRKEIELKKKLEQEKLEQERQERERQQRAKEEEELRKKNAVGKIVFKDIKDFKEKFILTDNSYKILASKSKSVLDSLDIYQKDLKSKNKELQESYKKLKASLQEHESNLNNKNYYLLAEIATANEFFSNTIEMNKESKKLIWKKTKGPWYWFKNVVIAGIIAFGIFLICVLSKGNHHSGGGGSSYSGGGGNFTYINLGPSCWYWPRSYRNSDLAKKKLGPEELWHEISKRKLSDIKTGAEYGNHPTGPTFTTPSPSIEMTEIKKPSGTTPYNPAATAPTLEGGEPGAAQYVAPSAPPLETTPVASTVATAPPAATPEGVQETQATTYIPIVKSPLTEEGAKQTLPQKQSASLNTQEGLPSTGAKPVNYYPGAAKPIAVQ